MTTEMPDIADTGRYSIKETAEILGVCRRSVDYYLKSGYLKCGRRRHNGYRFVTGREIKRFYIARR